MQDYQRRFLDLCVARQILRFGDFTLKSGRRSPYFFNAGLFCTGTALAGLGDSYARTLEDSGLSFDLLFGPAYKGITLAAATAVAYANRYDRDLPIAYDRKEAKEHGEGGNLIGAPLKGRVVIIDDVISSGTSIRQAAELIGAAGAQLAGVALALDRQERGFGAAAASAEIARRYGIAVISIVSLQTLVDYLDGNAELSGYRERMAEYRSEYGSPGQGNEIE